MSTRIADDFEAIQQRLRELQQTKQQAVPAAEEPMAEKILRWNKMTQGPKK